MSAVATKAISSKLFTGTFELRNHLVDHTTEEHANDIIASVNHTIEGYRARNPRQQAFTPHFAFGGVEGDSSKLVLYVMIGQQGQPHTNVGEVALKWKKISERAEILVMRKQAKQSQIDKMNAHFTFPDLKTALSIRNVSLKDPRNDLLAHSLEFFELMHRKYPAAITFDLELSDEGVTLVTFKDFQRYSAVQVFTQQ